MLRNLETLDLILHTTLLCTIQVHTCVYTELFAHRVCWREHVWPGLTRNGQTFWPGLQKLANHVWPTTTIREMWWPPLPMASLSSSKDWWSTLMPLFWSSHWTPATLAENVYLAQLSTISKSFRSCDCCHIALSSDWQLIISMLSQRLLNSWKQKQHFITLNKN